MRWAAACVEDAAEGLCLVWGAQERSVGTRHISRACKDSKDRSCRVLRPEFQCPGLRAHYFSPLILCDTEKHKGAAGKGWLPGGAPSPVRALRPEGRGSE